MIGHNVKRRYPSPNPRKLQEHEGNQGDKPIQSPTPKAAIAEGESRANAGRGGRLASVAAGQQLAMPA